MTQTTIKYFRHTNLNIVKERLAVACIVFILSNKTSCSYKLTKTKFFNCTKSIFSLIELLKELLQNTNLK